MNLSSEDVEIILDSLNLYLTFLSERMIQQKYEKCLNVRLKFKVEAQKHYVEFSEELKKRFPNGM